MTVSQSPVFRDVRANGRLRLLNASALDRREHLPFASRTMLSTRPISLNSDVDVAGHSTLSTKTPGRKASKSRNGLQENAVHTVGPKTVFKKSALQTPFRPGTARTSLK